VIADQIRGTAEVVVGDLPEQHAEGLLRNS
jgi:hypothetical protein